MRAPPLFTLLAFSLLSPFTAGFAAEPAIRVATGQEHRGWHNAIILRNGLVEAVIVPSVGRVMQFRFAGESDGPFWENEQLAGRPMPTEPWKAAHGSFGGDKTWPAPQSLWNWPPPDVFDTVSLTARVNDDRSVTLTSPVSPRFGLRTVRHINLDPAAAILRIATTYEKVAGEPLAVSVWIISQLRDPVAVYLPAPASSKFSSGLAPQWSAPPGASERRGDLLRLVRLPAKSYKVGNDSPAIVWVGAKHLLKISAERIVGAPYPDEGCIAEFYGNADPIPYVELETVSPLKTLRVGDTHSATNTYVLARRSSADPEADARDLLSR
jgi:hypothetical protein